jgi:ABC-type lipoprotein release transport system permease subunit
LDSKLDPATFVAAPVFLSTIALTASYMPARRAMGVDPVSALHTE